MPLTHEKPKERSKPRKGKGKRRPYIPNEAETTEIENISSSFTYEEMSFDSWRNFDKNLDLIIMVALTKLEAEEGTTKNISWSVSIVKTGIDAAKRRERQRVSRVITFPPKITGGWCELCEGLGDSCDEKNGDARIIVRIV